MKVYRNCYYNNSDSSQGFEYFKNKSEAKKAMNEFKHAQEDNFDDDRSSIDAYECKISAQGIIDVLNVVAAHPDNG